MAITKNKPGTHHLSIEINVWYNPDDESIHITNKDSGSLHTTVNNKPGSERCHRNLYSKLEKLLKETGRWPE